MSEKRFTDVNVDFEESWIRLKDNGDFFIFPISFNDKEEYGLETLEDLLNGLSEKIDEQQATIERLTNENENLESNIKWFKHQFDKLKRFEDCKNKIDSDFTDKMMDTNLVVELNVCEDYDDFCKVVESVKKVIDDE